MKTLLVLTMFLSESFAFVPTDSRSVPTRQRSLAFGASRQEFMSTAATFLAGSIIFPKRSNADSTSIPSCPKSVGNAKVNCASTAAVRQVDNYISPWTYPSSMPLEEVMGRLKGVINTDIKLTVKEQGEKYLRAEGIRNFSTDQIEFLVNTDDHIITFISQQIDGPDVGDFGANRKRLDDLRKRAGIFRVMGEEYARESALGQLKAFYGLQSGAGFEDVILDYED